MRESIINCSYLKDHIKYLQTLSTNIEAEFENNVKKNEFNRKYMEYQDVRSQLKYAKMTYKYNCGLYELFCSNFYKN